MYLIIFLLCFGFQEPGGLLLESYTKQVTKVVDRVFDTKNVVFIPVGFDQPLTEVYRIEKDSVMIGSVFLKSVQSCNIGGCTAPEKNTSGSREFFDLLIVSDLDDSIKAMRVLNYFSDYGYEISSKKYLRKYIGRSPCDFINRDATVDAISGATISSSALINAINDLCVAKNVLAKT